MSQKLTFDIKAVAKCQGSCSAGKLHGPDCICRGVADSGVAQVRKNCVEALLQSEVMLKEKALAQSKLADRVTLLRVA